MKFILYSGIIFLLSCAQKSNSGERDVLLNQKIDSLQNQLTLKSDSIKQLVRAFQIDFVKGMFFSQMDLMCIHAIDSTINEDTIKAQLKRRDDLIPIPPYFDGSPIGIVEVVLLRHPWAYCYISDGHIAGYMLVEYIIKPKKAIQFKVLKYYIDEC